MFSFRFLLVPGVVKIFSVGSRKQNPMTTQLRRVIDNDIHTLL
jgi:hypothetical protein